MKSRARRKAKSCCVRTGREFRILRFPFLPFLLPVSLPRRMSSYFFPLCPFKVRSTVCRSEDTTAHSSHPNESFPLLYTTCCAVDCVFLDSPRASCHFRWRRRRRLLLVPVPRFFFTPHRCPKAKKNRKYKRRCCRQAVDSLLSSPSLQRYRMFYWLQSFRFVKVSAGRCRA